MAFTNAEKQARFRKRRDNYIRQLEGRVEELQAELTKLRRQLEHLINSISNN